MHLLGGVGGVVAITLIMVIVIADGSKVTTKMVFGFGHIAFAGASARFLRLNFDQFLLPYGHFAAILGT